MRELGEAMQRGEKGRWELMLDGQLYFVYYQPIPTTGWSLGIFCPESEIFSGYDRLQRNLIMSLVAALLLMFLLFVWLIRRQLAPLGKLANEAD